MICGKFEQICQPHKIPSQSTTQAFLLPKKGKKKKKKANCLYHSPGRSNHCNVAIYNKIQKKS